MSRVAGRLRLAIRRHRAGLVTVTLIGFGGAYLQAYAFGRVAGHSPAERQNFAHQMELLAAQIAYLLPKPRRVDTVGGYLGWRVYGLMPVVFAVWALFASTGAFRGEDGDGWIEQWLAAGVSRVQVVVVRATAFVVVVAVAGLGLAAGGWLGALSQAERLDPHDAVLGVVPACLIGLLCFGMGALVAQLLPTRAQAAGLAGVVLAALFAINSYGRVTGLRDELRWISPFYLVDRWNPLAGGAVEWVPALVQILFSGALVALAGSAFRLRDCGSGLLRLRAAERVERDPSANRLLTIQVLRGIWRRRTALAAWGLGLGFLAVFMAVFMASLSRSMVDLLQSVPALRGYLAVAGSDPGTLVTGFFWFGAAQLILSGFVVVRVAAWAADDREGRLGAAVASGGGRLGLAAERTAELLVEGLVITAVASLALYVGARGNGLSVAVGALVRSTILLVPVMAAFAGLGGILVGIEPAAAVSVLALAAAYSYLGEQLGPILGWPDWVRRSSVYELYGTPWTGGVYWQGLWILLGIGVLGWALSAILLQRRDLGG